jgi:hypothetical protein
MGKGATTMQPPVDLVVGNKAFTGKVAGRFSARRCWAGYELIGPHYAFMPADKALAFHDELTAWLRDFADVREVDLKMLPVAVNAAEEQAEFANQADRDLQAEARDYCGRVSRYLGETFDKAGAVRFRWFVFIQLPTPPVGYPTLKEWLRAAVFDGREFAETVAGVGRPEIQEHQLDGWAKAEHTMRARLNTFSETQGGQLQFRALYQRELLTLIRAPFWRAIGTPPLADGWAPEPEVRPGRKGVAVKPDRSAMRRLYSGLVHHRDSADCVRVTQLVGGQAKAAYQAFLTIEQWTVNPVALLGGEWAYQLQQEVGHVELHVRWNSRSHELTLGDLESQKRKQDDNASQEDEHAGGTSAETARGRDEAEEMAAYVRETRSPSLMVSVVIGVAAPTMEALQDSIRRVQAVFDRLDIKVVQNSTDQFKHFYECMVGARRQVHDYVHRLLPPALAAAMFGATVRLLDPMGTYVGVDHQGRPVWYDPTRALAQLDTSGSAAFLGPMGKGKSVTANFLAFLAVLLRGARLLAIDSAKPERSGWPDHLPYLGRYTKVVTLSAHESDRGKLDPFVIFSSRSEATNHAISQAAFLTQTKLSDTGYDALLKACTWVRDNCEKPSMMACVDQLEQLGRDPDYKYRSAAARLAERLRNISTLAFASLLFGDEHSAGIDTSHRITVLQLDRIQRPPEGKPIEDYSLDEYVSAAIMVATVALASAFASSDRRQQKVILTDETRWFTATEYGRNLIEQQTLIGRAMGTQVFLVGQNVAHLPQDLHQHFTMRLAFGAASDREAVATLRFLGAEPTADNVEWLKSLNPGDTKGMCLVRDLNGNIAQMQVDLVFEDLRRAFNTSSLESGEFDSETEEAAVG